MKSLLVKSHPDLKEYEEFYQEIKKYDKDFERFFYSRLFGYDYKLKDFGFYKKVMKGDYKEDCFVSFKLKDYYKKAKIRLEKEMIEKEKEEKEKEKEKEMIEKEMIKNDKLENENIDNKIDKEEKKEEIQNNLKTSLKEIQVEDELVEVNDQDTKKSIEIKTMKWSDKTPKEKSEEPQEKKEEKQIDPEDEIKKKIKEEFKKFRKQYTASVKRFYKILTQIKPLPKNILYRLNYLNERNACRNCSKNKKHQCKLLFHDKRIKTGQKPINLNILFELES